MKLTLRKTVKWLGVIACASIIAFAALGLLKSEEFEPVFKFEFAGYLVACYWFDWSCVLWCWDVSDFEREDGPVPTTLPRLSPRMPQVADIEIPSLGALVAIVIPTALIWWLDRRRPAPGNCRCGYDLTGNTSGRCPECGANLQAT